MIEWPPPGLESIHRRIHRLTVRAWIATVLLCPLVLWLLVGAPGLDPQGGGSLLSLLALAGITAFLSAITGAAGVIDQMRRARRLGYPTDVIVDVATDTNGTAAAWFGSAEMSNVRDVTRVRARSLRRSAALLAAFAAIMPPPLLALGLLLALRGAASLNAVLAIVLLPSLFALVTAAMLRGYALLLIQWDRGSAQWDPEPVTVQDRARDWIARTQQHAAPRPPAPGQLALVLVTALAGIAIFIFTAFTTAAAIAGGVGTRSAGSVLVRGPIGGERALLVELARRERLPADSAIDPRTAGVQLHYVLFAGGRRSDGMHDIPRDVDREWHHALIGPRWPAQHVWQRVLADSAAADALADSEHPAVDIALRIARAPVVDVFGGRWRDDVPLPLSSVTRYEPGNYSLLQHAIVARAARAARERRYDDAERDLRALVSLGFLLLENSPAASDQARGNSMVRDGHSVLGGLRSLRGDSTTQLMLRTLDEAGASRAFTTDYDGGSIGGLRRLAAGETGAYRAQRWQAALTIAVAERCGSLRAVLFGPPAAEYLEQRLHRSLVRFPSEQRLFDVIHDPGAHPESLPALPLPRRWAGTRVIESILGERHARSICYAALRM